MADVPAIALINGVESALADARLAVTDDGVARGDGAFETIGVWSGRPFLLEAHLDRLERSLRAIGLPPPDRRAVQADIARLADRAAGADGVLRVYLTGSGSRIVTLAPQPPRTPVERLVPQPAPWVRPDATYGPAGAKSMSYGPNMAATRAAQRAGGDDALLVSLEGLVLEGPTFAVLWTDDGETLRTPAPELGIVDSITRRALLDVARARGLGVEFGRYPLESLKRAREFGVCSAIRGLLAVRAVGDLDFPEDTPVLDLLAQGLDAARRAGTST